jgi:adenosylcobinamide-phosphate synthase
MFGITAGGTLLLAVGLDLLIGDPESRFHPVALLGKAIAGLEGLLYRDAASSASRRLAGAVLVLVSAAPVCIISSLLLALLERESPLLAAAAGGFFLWSTIGANSLKREARRVLEFLQDGDLQAARERLGLIVGRDTEHLDEGEITRATVETVAENISDGVIAPLFYFAVGGVPLALTYRVINTLDSMVGYRNERYRDFGWFAARLDDVANFLPALLTALLLAAGAFLLGYDWRRALSVTWRDAGKHASPNSGYPEAAVAGALGIRLGGLNYYQGIPSLRAHLGDPLQPLERSQIAAAVRLVDAVLFLFLFFYFALFLLAGGSNIFPGGGWR